MNFSDVITWTTGLLQLGIACYALRLNRLFGTARVGWSLFTAFTLLALLHLFQSLGPLSNGIESGIEMHVIYAFISLLLLTSMVHIKALFQERLRVEQEEQRVQSELELRVKEKTADLTRANEELQQEVVKHKMTATKLEAEIIERQRIASEMENTHKELLAASRQAAMTEFATNVLHNVGNVLNSANISASFIAEHLMQSKSGNIGRVVALMREHADDLGKFMIHDPRGQQLPGYLDQLSGHLAEEHTVFRREIELLKQKIEHIKEIVTMQQNYALVVGLVEKVVVTDLVEDALRMNSDALARHDVQVVREYEPQTPQITVERHKVLQILVNLVRNAKYACDESGRKDRQITLRVTHPDDGVRIVVNDNGVGIPVENLSKVFNYGFTTRKGGHGFGLHGSALAANDLGGALRAQSDGPDTGATFTLDLPLQPPRPQT